MTRQQKLILSCLDANVISARSPGLRRFATDARDAYLSRVSRPAKPKPMNRRSPDWDRPTP